MADQRDGGRRGHPGCGAQRRHPMGLGVLSGVPGCARGPGEEPGLCHPATPQRSSGLRDGTRCCGTGRRDSWTDRHHAQADGRGDPGRRPGGHDFADEPAPHGRGGVCRGDFCPDRGASGPDPGARGRGGRPVRDGLRARDPGRRHRLDRGTLGRQRSPGAVQPLPDGLRPRVVEDGPGSPGGGGFAGGCRSMPSVRAGRSGC